MAARQQRHLAVGDLTRFLGRSDDGEIDRKRHDGDADPQNEVGDVASDALALDHQYVTLRSI